MWRRRITSYLDILHFRLFEYALPEVMAQILRSAKINSSTTEESRKLPFHACHTKQAGNTTEFKLDQHVNVAVWPKIRTQR